MSYNSTGTPRFWISTIQWLNSKGLVLERGDNVSDRLTDENGQAVSRNIFNINPVNPNILKTTTDNLSSYHIGFNVNLSSTMKNKNNFSMFLGHSFKSNIIRDVVIKDMDQTDGIGVARENYVNGSDNSDSHATAYNGFSINIGNNNNQFLSASPPNTIRFEFQTDYEQVLNEFKVGSILYGNYYDMPHSVNLDMSMSFEMDGIKTSETLGGSTLVHRNYTQAPMWGNLGAWELGGKDEIVGNNVNLRERDLGLQRLRKSGRRVWNLSFSYLQDQDVFPEISNLTNYEHKVKFFSQPAVVCLWSHYNRYTGERNI